MTTRRKLRQLVLLAFVTCVASIAVFLLPREKVTKAEVEQMIRRDLPDGAPDGDVIRFLDNRGLWHSGYTEGEQPIRIPTTPTDLIPVRKRYVIAKVSNAKSAGLTRWDIYIVFFFDQQRRLLNYDIMEIGAGL
jgi:hypothetical protein